MLLVTDSQSISALEALASMCNIHLRFTLHYITGVSSLTQRHYAMVPSAGLEPATCESQVRCPANSATMPPHTLHTFAYYM